MDVKVYIKNEQGDYVPLSLFGDEKITLNMNVKDLSDISKIRADFTQDFTVPADEVNNPQFQYWYDADVDGTFNANIRVDSYIELFTLPFRYGSIQLNDCQLKNNQPSHYSNTFYAAGVNLSDKFADDLLSSLPLSDYDHTYSATILDATYNNSLSSGDIYYPLINAFTFMDAGNNAQTDLLKNGNDIDYRDFKPAIRDIKIIEAIEQKYGVTFSRDFFDRALFYNKFLWLHKEAGRMKVSSTALEVDFTSTDIEDETWTVTPHEINTTTNSVRLLWSDIPTGWDEKRQFILKLYVNTTAVNQYKVDVYDNGVFYSTFENLQGNTILDIYNNIYQNDPNNHLFTFKVSSLEGSISFTTQIELTSKKLNIFFVYRRVNGYSASQTTANSIVKISEQIPEMKVKDYFNSLISEFNLVIKPTSIDTFHIDTLDNWYSKGKLINMNPYVDISEIKVKKPNVKKQINFAYQKSETILAKKYFDTYQQGYGDLKATFNIAGDELKIESGFENIMFERLVDEGTGLLTELQVGYAVNLENKPVKGKPISFYRNGIETHSDLLHIDPSFTTYSIWHTATEDNKVFDQVTNSLNFGADNSTYFYAPINNSLYSNFWRTYIEELYNRKTRVLSFKCKIPARILQTLEMNDRFIIGDKKYKLSTISVDLTTGDATCEAFTDLGFPFDSIDNIIPITVDRTDITVDNDILTVDRTTEYSPVSTFTINGISLTEYNATKGEEHFELKITASVEWTVAISDTFVTSNKMSGNKSDYLRVSIAYNSGASRSATLTVTMAGVDYELTINQA